MKIKRKFRKWKLQKKKHLFIVRRCYLAFEVRKIRCTSNRLNLFTLYFSFHQHSPRAHPIRHQFIQKKKIFCSNSRFSSIDQPALFNCCIPVLIAIISKCVLVPNSSSFYFTQQPTILILEQNSATMMNCHSINYLFTSHFFHPMIDTTIDLTTKQSMSVTNLLSFVISRSLVAILDES